MNEEKKLCVDCKTTKTPLWRTGPHGPRSLCNACGIRYRKRKMAEQKQPISEIRRDSSKSGDFDDQYQINESLNMRYDYSKMSNRVFARKSSSFTTSYTSSSSSSSSSSLKLKKQRSNNSEKSISSSRNLSEVEQAAVLLMFLSCGSVFA